MKPEEKAYIAGIIDGEGSIMLTKFHKNQFPAPCVTVASTSLELLEWIKDTSGLGTIKSKKNYNPEKHHYTFTYITRYNDAIALLQEIEEYLVIPQKRLRSEMITKEYKGLTPRNGRYTDEMIKSKEEFYGKFMAVQDITKPY